MREPDFNNLLAVLDRKVPARPTLFEYFMNDNLYAKLAGLPQMPSFAADHDAYDHAYVKAFYNAGYDYCTVGGSAFAFQTNEFQLKESRSANEGAIIHDRQTFNQYHWPEPEDFDYSYMNRTPENLPAGMKFIVTGPGLLETVIDLVGYENTCIMAMDDPKLLHDIFDAVGSRIIRHYQIAAKYPAIGAMITSDDWGFKTQTMLSPPDMRKFVFTWHKKIVKAIHDTGRHAILHSCGNLTEVMDDIIDDMKYDAKHSYEDAIEPVEQAYEKYAGRIAILGGIDLDFVVRSTPEKILQRCRAMLERTKTRGAYALGTGNSVPTYVPNENYFAMTAAVME